MTENEINALVEKVSAVHDALQTRSAELDQREADLKAQTEQLEAREQNLEQERSAHNPENPANFTREESVKMELRDIAEKMASEQRAITVNGTGAVNVINQLFKEAMQKDPILSRVRYFYGANANTVIPVLAPRPAIPSRTAEGANNISADSTAVLSAKTLVPYTWTSILPISYETGKLSAVNLESELPSVFSDSFGKAMADNVVTGAGTGTPATMKGIFSAVPTANKIACASSGLPTIADLYKLAMTLVDLNLSNPCIVISSTVYTNVITSTVTGYDFCIEELKREHKIEGIDVIITGKAPSTTTAGSLIAWGGSLDNYAVAVAGQLDIDVRTSPLDSNYYWNARMIFTGDVICPNDTYGLKTV